MNHFLKIPIFNIENNFDEIMNEVVFGNKSVTKFWKKKNLNQILKKKNLKVHEGDSIRTH